MKPGEHGFFPGLSDQAKIGVVFLLCSSLLPTVIEKSREGFFQYFLLR